MKRKTIRVSVIILTFILFLIGYYYPFEIEEQYCGHFSLCKVKFGVYIYDYDSEVGNLYFWTDIQFGEKVGGLPEYLGLKKVKCGNENTYK